MRSRDNSALAGQGSTLIQPLDAHTEDGAFAAQPTPESYFNPRQTNLFNDYGDDQGWLFDPLSALDFSNFAQGDGTESFLGVNLF